MLSGTPAWRTPSVVEIPLRADDWIYFNERAAILEFDAGLSRSEAEAEALACCLATQRLDRQPPTGGAST